MKPYRNILEAIGHTPIVQLNKVVQGIPSKIYAKVESLNPGGSVKDRIGLKMIEEAERTGKLKPGGTIVEATSGNTGFGLAIAAAVKGYKTIFVLPDKMSNEKIQNLRAFGAKVIITPTAVDPDDPRSYYSVSKKIAQETPGAFYANQYHNPINPKAHYESTGPEIWEQMNGSIDCLVAGMGTGGTISGVAQYLKEKNPKIKVIGVDPIGSVFYQYFKTGKVPKEFKTYKIEGIGEDFLPGTMDFKHVDEVIQVSDRESFLLARQILLLEGIFVGGSSGSALAGAVKYAKQLKDPLNILVIFPDSGDRYLSKVFNDDWMRENGFLNNHKELGSIRDLLATQPQREIITTTKQTKISEVIQKMEYYAISQLPVVENGKLLGLVAESDILRHIVQSGGNPAGAIEPLISDKFLQLSLDETIDRFADELEQGKVGIVYEGGKIFGLITKIDLLSYYSRRLR